MKVAVFQQEITQQIIVPTKSFCQECHKVLAKILIATWFCSDLYVFTLLKQKHEKRTISGPVP
jgi:hypothetical protein